MNTAARAAALVLLAVGQGLGAEAAPESRPVATSQAASRPATRPAAATQAVGKLVGFRLSPAPYPEGVTDEAGYRRYLEQRAAQLDRDAKATVSPVTRAHLLLALANHALAAQADEAATALLLGQATEDQQRDLHRLARRAIERIEAARGLLDPAPEGEDAGAASAEERTELRSAADALDGLAHTIAAVTTADSERRTTAVKRAAVRLAGVLENENPEVAAAARLWQGVALHTIGEPDATLAAIDLVLDAPQSLPFDFFSRILRCRTLAQRGGHTVAMGLSMRLEERCSEWFRDAAVAAQARRTAVVVAAATAAEWAEELRRKGKSDLARRVDALAARGRTAAAGALYRCTPVVPILVTAPAGGRVTFFSLSAYARSIILILDRPASMADDFPALIRQAKACVDGLTEAQEFQVFLLGSEGVEPVGDGNLLAATRVNRQRARDLLDAVSPVAEPRAAEALQRAFSLKPDRIFLFAASAVDEGVAKRSKAWNVEAHTVVDVIGVKGVTDKAAVERLATDNRGRARLVPLPLEPPATSAPSREANP